MANNLAGQRATCLLFLSGLEAVVLQDADGHGLDGISCWLGPDGRPERAMREAVESATRFAVTEDDLHWLGTITRPVGNNLDDRKKTSEAHHFYAAPGPSNPCPSSATRLGSNTRTSTTRPTGPSRAPASCPTSYGVPEPRSE